jgi:hypothetical protein
MKKQIKNITLLILGLLLTGLPSVANPTNWDVTASGSTTYILGGGSVNAPTNATVGWYIWAYATSPANSGGRVYVLLNGNQVLDKQLYASGSDSGSVPVSAGTVNCYLEAWQTGSAAAGCGVTVAW